eukprot:TRINITY_DN30281_c0_g1_i1.p1 TRINITY_DN30281_c0_g1~~TRINITY_DN30281_c0_g1_i1.p1  ORF type:complete len:104 (+),score=2.05 TRINITY_DN30281_c0_g1_i1:347-658(+)
MGIWMSLAHSLSLSASSFEMWLNKVTFHWPHLLFVFSFPLGYSVLYVYSVFCLNFTPYPILTMKSWDSIIIALIVVGLYLGAFWIGDYFTKNRKFGIQKIRNS